MSTEPNPGAAGAAAGTGGGDQNAGAAGNAGAGDPWFAKPELGLSQESQDYLGAKHYPGLEDAIKTKRQFETLARDRNAMTGPQEGKLAEWDGWQKLGWEPDATKYTLEKPKLKDGVAYAPEFHDALTKALHAQRVPGAMAKGVIAELGKAFDADHEASMAEVARQDAEMKTQLKTDWGDRFDANLELSKRAAAALGVNLEDKATLEDFIGAPSMVKLFHKFATLMGEERLVTASNSGQGGFGSQSPATARAERQRLEGDADFRKSLTDPRHALHAMNTEKRQRLLDLEAGAR